MSEQYYQPIQTELGTLFGRDAVYLDEVDYNFERNILTLIGSINGRLSSSKTDNWFDYKLIFKGIVAFMNYSIDSWDYSSKSSFDEVVKSDWKKLLNQKVTSTHKHYLLQTYDDVLEIMGGTFTLEITAQKT